MIRLKRRLIVRGQMLRVKNSLMLCNENLMSVLDYLVGFLFRSICFVINKVMF
jgi:hypothetical protein